jgi:hypothetical protein
MISYSVKALIETHYNIDKPIKIAESKIFSEYNFLFISTVVKAENIVTAKDIDFGRIRKIR